MPRSSRWTGAQVVLWTERRAASARQIDGSNDNRCNRPTSQQADGGGGGTCCKCTRCESGSRCARREASTLLSYLFSVAAAAESCRQPADQSARRRRWPEAAAVGGIHFRVKRRVRGAPTLDRPIRCEKFRAANASRTARRDAVCLIYCGNNFDQLNSAGKQRQRFNLID